MARLSIPLILVCTLSVACGEADSAGAGHLETSSETGTSSSGTDATSLTESGGFTDSTSTTAADTGTTGTQSTMTSAGTESGDGDAGLEEGGDGDEGEELGEPNSKVSILELWGTLGTSGEVNGEGAFSYIEFDAMGVGSERCLIDFTVTHASNPADCSACSEGSFESQIGDVWVEVDDDNGCADSMFDPSVLNAPIKWGVAGESLYVDEGMGWTLVEAGEAWADETEMEAYMARWDLGVNEGGQ